MSPGGSIAVAAPNRIDLAGGTLDVYPLYLFEDGGLTVNAAVSVMSRARITPRTDSQVILTSNDRNETVRYATPADVDPNGALPLVARAVRCYAPPCGVEITVHNEAPQGSGLGASSALLMALSVGLLRLRGLAWTAPELIDVGANLEAQVLATPTGKQDYYPALCGGVSALEFDERGHRRRELCASAGARAFLEDHLVLSFTGTSHFSGATNWHMLRNYIEGNGAAREALRGIKRTAERMLGCLEREAWAELPGLLREEWEHRRALAEGVSTPQVDRLMRAAEDAGARASKLCGAGGGGCMVTFVDPERRSAVERALTGSGATVLPFTFVARGVEVKECRTA